MRKQLLIILAALCPLVSPAQDVTVEAALDSMAIFIGQQVGLTLSVSAPDSAVVQMPQFKDRDIITPGVEIVGDGTESVEKSHGQTIVRRKWLLTSFDEDAYKIPEQTVKVSGKEYRTNPLALKVLTVEVDTTALDSFFPPKDVQDNPFLWSEWRGIYWLSVVMFLLIAAAIYLYIRFKQNKPIISRILIIRHIPAHQKALSAIEKIKGEKIYNDSDQKLYYTKLTDTLRRYIQERFGFSAMEMTSSEIISALQNAGNDEMIDELRNLFRVADLVKFAKYSTPANENDINLVNAVNFIDRTKTQETEREERITPKLSETDRRVQESRKLIKVLLAIITAAVVIILCYIIFRVMQLF
ncbi:MAG: BatD family protein [Prevotella sp.]|nr:BatD family protein [Prevotella sp.]